MGYTLPRLYKLFDLGNWNGIGEISGITQINLFPNPVTSELTVSVGEDQKPISSIQLFDVSGRLAVEKTRINAFADKLDLAGMENGVYLISVKLIDGTSATRKVTIEK